MPILATTRVRILGRERPGSGPEKRCVYHLGPRASALSLQRCERSWIAPEQGAACTPRRGTCISVQAQGLTAEFSLRKRHLAFTGSFPKESSRALCFALSWQIALLTISWSCRTGGGKRPVGLLRKTSSSQRIGKETTDLSEIMNDGTGPGSAGEGERMGMKV